MPSRVAGVIGVRNIWFLMGSSPDTSVADRVLGAAAEHAQIEEGPADRGRSRIPPDRRYIGPTRECPP